METWRAPGGIGAGRIATVIIVAPLTTLTAVGCGSKPFSSPQNAEPPVVVAAGDIASCASEGDEATADLLSGFEGTVVTLGDHAYPDGSVEDFGEAGASNPNRNLKRPPD